MLHLDITGTLAKILSPSVGIPDAEITAQKTSVRRVISDINRERKEGKHEWMNDPTREEAIRAVMAVAEQLKKEKVQTIVWIGIGGSGLGPKVLQEVFETPDTVEFILVDTIDPALLELYRTMVDWKHAAIVVVSKSGETLESMSAFFLYYEELKNALGKKAAQRVVAITDPESGSLRKMAVKEGFLTLPIPPNVGGRYCIFSPVGLLPLALFGTDVRKFLQGATDMDALCSSDTIDENPAALLAVVQFILESKKGYIVRVIMPYIQKLQSIARWNQQLIAESLGKTEIHNPIPLAAIGTQDQHSMLQQWTQGPRKCWHLFITEVEKQRVTVPKVIPAEWHYISGKSFGQLLDSAYSGTSQGLTAAKRAHATISIGRLDEYHLGQLFWLLLAEVIVLGKLYRIDPYGQPGVELSKKITKELLGRERE